MSGMNKLSEARKIGKWFFSNPYAKFQNICSFMSREASDIGFYSLVLENKDYIDLVTFEDFCKTYNINVKKKDIVIPHPSYLIGEHLLVMFNTEIYTLCMLAKGINTKKFFEIGTSEGETISNIAYNISDDAEMYTLECQELDIIGRFIKEDKKVASKVKMIQGDSTTFDYSPYHDQIDMMFVDGDTSYDIILSDSENAVKCVRDKGFIVWHDFFGLNKNYNGLVLALFKICRKYDLKLHLIDGTRLVIVQNNKNKK